ncbi:LTA synthase family protein [Proteinivorax tanatarense]|uniref:LTA synthase family protein n=1 Tax=Proteinivorax tanatarense TaxID=1260629 RepID=A0AAU7VJE3_9FIRM
MGFKKLNKLNLGYEHLKEVLLFSTLTLIKMLIFHHFMNLNSGILLITFNNFILVLAIYCLVDICSKENRIRNLLIAHFLISSLFFIEKLYFSHFFTLIPIHSVYQIGQIGGVSESIFTLIKPIYFLFFLDCFFLLYYSKKFSSNILLQKKHKLVSISLAIILILTTLFVNSNIVYSSKGVYSPYNLGLMNYHFYDIYSLLSNRPSEQKKKDIDQYIHQNDLIDEDTFGLAENKNIFILQLESIHNFVINKKVNGQYITPVLNGLIAKDSFYFDNYFEQVSTGNTSDAEFVSNNSFYPSDNVQTYSRYEENSFMSFPQLLKEQKDYSTMVFHGFHAEFWNREDFYKTQGIDSFISMEQLYDDEIIGMGISDGSVFDQSLDYLMDSPQPFYAKYITLTSHTPFKMDEKYHFLDLPKSYHDTLVGDYLQTVKYLDTMIGSFLKNLKEKDLYDNSIFIIYGDHKGLRVEDENANQLVSKLIGKTFTHDEMYKVPMIIHIPNSDLNETISTTGGMIDFYPTVGNLMGLKLDGVPILGRNLFNVDEGFAVIKDPMGKGSFIDDDKIFLMSNDGVFENSTAWNLKTGEPVDLSNCKDGYKKALYKLNLSEYILDNNLISE